MALDSNSTIADDGSVKAQETYVKVAENVPHPPGPHPEDQPTNLSVLNDASPVDKKDDELGGAQPGVAGTEVAPDAPKDVPLDTADTTKTDAKK